MKKWLQEDTQIKVLFFITTFIFCVVLVPLFVLGHYNFLSVDDYSFAMNAARVWKETGSAFKVFGEQLEFTKNFYFTWQGTFFDVWLTTSLLGILGEQAYYAGTYLSLGGMVIAEMFGIMTILVKCLGADKMRAGIVAMSYICIQVLLTPVPVEGFYWFCGAMRYTFIHALAWILVALLVRLGIEDKRSLSKTVIMETIVLLLTIAIGGSNYITGITMLLFYFFYVLWMFCIKHPAKMMMACNSLVFLVAFMINMLAPGNQIRQQSSDVEHLSVVETIIRSIKEASEYVLVNAIPPCIIVAIMLVPLFVSIVKRKECKYPWPLVVSLVSCGIFAAQFAPNLYALQFIGSGRVLNLYRFNFYLLLYGNEFYWIGWLWRRFREKNGENLFLETEGKRSSWLLPGWCLGILVTWMSLCLWGGSTVTTASAIESLRSGSAQQYYAENQQRLELLREESLKEVYLFPLSQKPYLLYFGDIVENTGDWVNGSMANYFNKEKVGLKQE